MNVNRYDCLVIWRKDGDTECATAEMHPFYQGPFVTFEDYDRLREERDRLARRIKALSILSCDPDDIEDPALDAFLGSWHPMKLGSNVCAYLDKTADALEAAGLLPKEEQR